ncbi:hypothetical protein PVAP13_3NG258196 [Panicum virgatum]|uniref:Uncharacterized protein n=1 Tax=Panicum virgatum TaxID=38727 RepID=A0A8T0U5F7_PANVG|nr:hypothetical protein PVAP13_3NG258196 [Panicum virgatum]
MSMHSNLLIFLEEVGLSFLEPMDFIIHQDMDLIFLEMLDFILLLICWWFFIQIRLEWMMTHLVTGAHATFLTRGRAGLRS